MSLILIVDDEAAIRELLARWLNAAGHEIREADSAEAALELMSRECADVVMCDIEMPGHGGVWMAAQLREAYPTTAMVLATALDTIPPETSFKSGIVAYLVKPFAREPVLQAVAAGLGWHAAAVERARTPAAERTSVATWLDASDDVPPGSSGGDAADDK